MNASVSIIMPVYNGVAFLPKSLPPLVAMLRRGEVAELVVVDDTSTDATASMARSLGAQVVPSGGRLGPGGARNQAARDAVGDILWFVDADVVVHDDAARELLAAFDDPAIVAVFGSYDDRPDATNFLSQYKNLVHHFYHHRGKRDASTFWAGCGGVRRDAFLAVHGFDVERYKRPSIEDIELGYRLRGAGGRIVLSPALQGTHLKDWRLGNLLHTEIFCRAIPWSRLMLSQTGLVDDLNVGRAERLRAVAAALFFVGCAAVVLPGVPWWIPLVLLAGIAAANAGLVRLFWKRKGALFALGGLLFHQVYYVYSSAAFAACVLEHHWLRLTRRASAGAPPAS